jgi:hypothetical protein
MMGIKAGAIRAGRAFIELFVDDKEAVRNLQAFGAKVKAFGTSLAQTGKSMMLWGGGATVAFAFAANAAAEFDAQMQKVATMLKGKDMQFMPEFRKSVKQFAVEFGKST